MNTNCQIKIIFPQGCFLANRKLLESYLDSVIGSYLLEHPDINELDIKECNFQYLNLETFIRIYDYLTNQTILSDISLKDLEIIDLLGFDSVPDIQIQYHLRKKMNFIYKPLNDLLEHKISFLQIDNTQLNLYKEICNFTKSFYFLRLYKFKIKYENYILIETNDIVLGRYTTYLGMISLNRSNYEKIKYNFDESIKIVEITKITISQLIEFARKNNSINFLQNTNHENINDPKFVIGCMECDFLFGMDRTYTFADTMLLDENIIKQIKETESNINKYFSNNLVDKILNHIHKIINYITFEEIQNHQLSEAHVIINI
jgi:hypothetical protein